MPTIVEVEKRDAAGRLLARVRLVDGVVDGPCVFYAEDGETVIASGTLRKGVPVAGPPSRLIADPAAPPGDSRFRAPGDSPF
ncbi:hypothetical protein HL658_34030 [Azospirillum sp. RWY-5-1]|uniref:Uncharacterized protein n=1 Tax=Azospirillum oleiclasticum TaxID=2735135 RepID=A0ABX2TLM8_9PROT|nr:hypothetical protein [Azospirillum oleiclasticum]NYZ17590.1 hypothetical protein [Azospirillum oleiclasticum]NYZ24942.1 hypothetical protein [Azospirillum oleiclasticum]